MLYLTACPVCQGKNLVPYLSCKDNTVSHETFQLESCAVCGFVMTNPRPGENNLPRYYQSDTYISHSDGSSTPLDLLYKLSRKFTLKWKYSLIQQYSLAKPLSILDYGCGTGSFLKQCERRKMAVTGVEPSAVARSHAQKDSQIQIFQDISEIKDNFDVITLWHVLEHVSDLHKTLNVLKARLHETGTMFIAVPNLNSPDARKYREHWAAYDVPRHLWHFSQTTMDLVLRQHQLHIHKIQPMRLDAYYVSLLSEKYKTSHNVVLRITKALINGWKSNRAAKLTNDYSSLIYIVRK